MTAAAISTPLRGALWMALGSTCYVISGSLARELGPVYSAFELTFIRAVIAVAIVAPMLMRAGRGVFRAQSHGLHVLNGIFTYAAVLCWFYAAARIPVEEFFALQFTTPLFTIALAMVILRQKVGAGHWFATFAGFAGVLIVLRPGLVEVSLGALATLASSFGYAGANTLIKLLSRHQRPMMIVFYVNLLMVPLSLPMALVEWRTPAWADWPLIVGMSVFSTIAFLAVARAIALTDARVVQPVNFIRLPLAAAIGFFFFNEAPDLWTWAGALVIFGCAYYVVTRGARRPAA
jgi:drug/metabolite transporter (DMT)-like permease